MSEFNAMLSKLESAGAIIHRDIDLRRWTGEDNDMFRALSCKSTCEIHFLSPKLLKLIVIETMTMGLVS